MALSFLPTERNAYATRRVLAGMRAEGLRLLAWAPRRDALPEAVQRHVWVLEQMEQRARDCKDIVAQRTLAARIRHLLREGIA